MPSGPRPQPPVGTVRVALSGVFGTLPWTNVVYLKLTDDGTRTSADLKTITDALANAWHTRFSSQLSSSVTLEDAKSVWITGVGTALEYDGSYSLACAGGTGLANAASAIVVNWAINQYYRGGHPRMYLPGVLSGNVTNFNELTGAYQAAIATDAGNWMTDVNALTGVHVSATQLGTVSFASGNAWRTPPIFRAYQAANVRLILGTQRRRLGGR